MNPSATLFRHQQQQQKQQKSLPQAALLDSDSAVAEVGDKMMTSSPMASASASPSSEGPSPTELAFAVANPVASLAKIASDHGLSHDSGVSFNSTSTVGKKAQRGKETFASTSTIGPSTAAAEASTESVAEGSKGTSSTGTDAGGETVVSSSSSASSSGRSDSKEASSNKMVSESPGTTAAFDARDDTWADVARHVKPFGDTLRHDRLRSTLGKSDLSRDCITLVDISVAALEDGHFDNVFVTLTDDPSRSPLDSSLYEAQTELMRVLGNLCIDDDTNRSMLLEAKGWKSIINLLATILQQSGIRAPTFSMQVLTLLRSATGALLNMQLDHSETRAAMRKDVDTVRTLLTLATCESVYVTGEWFEEKLLVDRLSGPRSNIDVKPESADEEAMKGMTKMGASITAWAWRILQDVCTNEEAEKQGSASVEALDTPPADGAGQGPGTQGQQAATPPSTRQSSESEDEKAIEALVTAGAAPLLHLPLLSFLPPSAPHSSSAAAANAPSQELDEPETDLTARWYADDVSDLIDSDIDIAQLASELLESAALDSATFRQAALAPFNAAKQRPQSYARRQRTGRSPARWQSALEAIMAILEEAQPPREWSTESLSSGHSGPPPPSEPEAAQEATSTFARTKAAMARAIVAISGEDSNMAKLFGTDEEGQRGKSWFIETIKRWMGSDVSQRDDLVSTAMLSMGNLARTDEHCLALVQEHGMVPSLTQLVKADADIKVAHGVVSLLKNLSIPTANKLIIGSENRAVTLVAPYLGSAKDHVQPLQFATVGLLKHLCTGCTQNSLALVTESTADGQESVLDLLLGLVQRTDDVPTKMEGTRVLVNAIKTLWSSKDTGASGPSPARLGARSQLVSASVASALCEMVRNSPKYPVLVNEGIMSLALLGSEGSRGARLVARALLADPAAGALSDEDEPSQGQTMGSDRATLSSSPSQTLATGDSTAPGRKLPSRKPTNDSLASKSSQPPPPPPCCADMVSNVLARRDARMPPQFASNACSLVFGLVEADKRSSTSTASASASKKDQDDPLRKLVSMLRPGLIHLAEEGPQESLESAQRALKAVDEVLLPTQA